MKVLLVDDDNDTTFLMNVIFNKSEKVSGHQLFTRGADLLKYLDDCPTSDQPDIIFIDINMPEMDGFDVVEEFEENYQKNYPNTNLLMLTSSARSADMSRAKSYNSVKGFIIKPLNSGKLENLDKVIFIK